MTFPPFFDIHCHMLPGIDDGAKDEATALAMARMAVEDGFRTTITTPHQLGGYACNKGDDIRARVQAFNQRLAQHQIPLTVLPGGDVRIEEGLVQKIQSGEVMTLADHRKHVLLELPHELYVPLEPLLDALNAAGIVGILSHPERNAGILQRPQVLEPLVARGCLMQVTAGSLIGTFGSSSRQLAEAMLCDGLVHFLATDAHSLKARCPKLQPAFLRAAELTNEQTATEICSIFPAAVVEGRSVPPGKRPRFTSQRKKSWWPWGKKS